MYHSITSDPKYQKPLNAPDAIPSNTSKWNSRDVAPSPHRTYKEALTSSPPPKRVQEKSVRCCTSLEDQTPNFAMGRDTGSSPCDVFTDIPTWPNIREVTTVNDEQDIFTDIPTWNNEFAKTDSSVLQSHQVDESSKSNYPQTPSEPMAQEATSRSCPLPAPPPLISTEGDQNILNVVNSAGMLAVAEKQNTADTETLYQALMELKGTTVSTDLFKLFAEKDGSRNGLASLQHGNYQFKVFFSVPTTDSRSGMLENILFPVISGNLGLSITGQELKEHIRNKPSNYYTQAHLQHDNPLPIYLDSSSIVVEEGGQVLTGEQRTVFDRIKRLDGRTITAEVIRYNPEKQTAVAWHQFSIGCLHYGVHIATPIKTPSLHSQMPNSLKNCKIQITGKVRVDKHRLASSIHQDFPHAYQDKYSNQSNGLPVYFLGHTVQLERMYSHRSHGY